MGKGKIEEGRAGKVCVRLCEKKKVLGENKRKRGKKRMGRKKRGRLSDNNYKANILSIFSVARIATTEEAVDCAANIALLLNYFQGIELD